MVPPDTIAASYFYILRPKPDIILPHYLAWYINQIPAQNYIRSQIRGSYMQIIPKAEFELLEIEIPVISIQRCIIEFEHLRRREESLLAKLIDARQLLVQRISLKAVQDKKSTDRSDIDE